MSGKTPGTKGYDKQRAHLRKDLENSGEASDKDANERANEILQDEEGNEPRLQTERGLGPKSQRDS